MMAILRMFWFMSGDVVVKREKDHAASALRPKQDRMVVDICHCGSIAAVRGEAR
jgi:hypothetical protein